MASRSASSGIVVRLLTCTALLVATGMPARLGAQAVGGTILGTITDPSGAVIPDVQVSVKDVATQVVSTVTTNKDGYYSAPNLLPGTYEITASASGFESAVATNVILTVGAQQTVNLQLRVGQTTQRVEVTGAAAAVELATSTVSDVVTGTTVRELPLNGRSWTDLATLQAGVNPVRTQPDVSTSDRASRGWGDVLTISGNRPTQNNYRLNGISINDFTNASPGSIAGGGNPGVDAIGEFSVLTSSFSAEYGKSSGGVINAITKSGTNQLHGDAYEFIRNSALDARNFFDNKIPPFRRNQFGASVGGPIKKDKMFGFFDYEGLRQALGLSGVAFVPSPAARQGMLCAPPSCQTTTQVPINPNVAPFLGLWPVPNAGINCAFQNCPAGAGDTGTYIFQGHQPTTENYYTTRIDRKLGDKDSLFGTWFFNHAIVGQNDSLNDLIVDRATLQEMFSLEENHVFSPSVVNAVRAGYNRETSQAPSGATALNPIAADHSLGIAPGLTIGRIAVPGLTPFQGGLTLWSPQTTAWNTYQYYDDLFVTRGIHSLKFGLGYERDEINFNGHGGFYGGWSLFNNYENFLAGSPVSLIAGGGNSATSHHDRQTIFGLYAQDDMRLRPGLTVNAGLRYELAGNVYSVRTGPISALRHQTDPFPFNCSAAFCPAGGPLLDNPTELNFEPRVGFAWDPFGNGKTAIRGGFGVFDVLPQFLEYGSAIASSYPTLQSSNTGHIEPGTWPKGTFTAIAGDLDTKRVDLLQFNAPRNYVLQWNLNVQRDLGHNLTAMIGYVGTRGIHNVFQHDDSNIALPITSPVGYLWPCEPFVGGVCQGQGSGPRLNCCVGREPTQLWNSHSIYDGMQAVLSKKMSHGLQVQGAYTWSKCIDTSSGSGIGDPYVNSLSSSLYYWDQKARRALCDTNTSQNFVANYTWEIPTRQSLSGIAGALTKGWQLGGILTLQSGLPFTPLIAGDALGENNTDPFDYPDRLTGPGCQSLVNPGNVNNYIKLNCFAFAQPVVFNGLHYIRPGDAGRNILIGPGIATFDFSVFKNNYVRRISENFNIQFRAEMFNIFNRANFSPPTDNEFLFDQSGNPIAGAGVVDLTTTTSRQIQFALKIIF